MALLTVSLLSKSICMLPLRCQSSDLSAKSSTYSGFGIVHKQTTHYRVRATSAIVAQALVMGDHFDTLGLRRGASKKDIKTAYRRLALKYHPDICKDDDSQLRFMQINTAYERAMTHISGSDDELYGTDSLDIVGDSWADWEADLDYASQVSMYNL